MTKRSVMAAILQTAGPVSIRRAVASNWKFLKATGKMFKEAAVELEQIGFGSVVTISANKCGLSDVFVKKKPEDVEMALVNNKDLCTPDRYSTRFHSQASRHITLNMRATLVAQGLVLKKQFM